MQVPTLPSSKIARICLRYWPHIFLQSLPEVPLNCHTGFQNEQIVATIDHIWPKLKKALTAAPSMVVGVTEPRESNNRESLHKVDLALAELMVLTFADKSLFPGGNVPKECLFFMTFAIFRKKN